MLYVLTNDDGIEAEGLRALEAAVRGMGCEVLVVAPHEGVSECSHRVTTKEPLRLEERGEGRYAVHGSPADCTRVALLHLLPLRGVEVTAERVRVLSGINAGGNLGADIYLSGTVAAVREAAFWGIPGVAFSQYRRVARNSPEATNWGRATGWVRRVLEMLAGHEGETLGEGAYWNVNLPWPSPPSSPPSSPLESSADLAVKACEREPGIVFCERSRQPLPVKYEAMGEHLHYVSGLYHSRRHEPGSDIAVCFGGDIAVTLLHI